MNLLKPLTDLFKPKESPRPSQPPYPPPPAKSLTAKKMNDNHRMELVKMLAECYPQSVVKSHFFQDYGILLYNRDLSHYKYSEEWAPTFKKFRDKYMTNIGEIPGAHKKVRVARLDRVIETSFERNKLDRVVSATREQRNEMEGDKASVVFNQFNILSNEELEEKRKVTLEHIKQMEVINVKPSDEGKASGPDA